MTMHTFVTSSFNNAYLGMKLFWGIIPHHAIVHFASQMFPVWSLENSTSQSPATVSKRGVRWD